MPSVADMQKYFILFINCIIAVAYAQKDSTWKFNGILSVNGSQVALENWVSGGENAISVTNLVNLRANYKKNKTTWDNSLDMKVNKYISASVSTHLIYDQDIKVPVYEKINGKKVQKGEGPRVQFKEVLAIGFSYKF